MLRQLIVLSVIAVAAAGAASAQQKPALTCKDLAIPVNGLPMDTPLSISLTPAQLVAQCTSSTGDSLTLVSPQGGVSLAPAAGEAKSATFTVQDTHGNTASGQVTVSRN